MEGQWKYVETWEKLLNQRLETRNLLWSGADEDLRCPLRKIRLDLTLLLGTCQDFDDSCELFQHQVGSRLILKQFATHTVFGQTNQLAMSLLIAVPVIWKRKQPNIRNTRKSNKSEPRLLFK
jgi:hypothetical protein